MGSFQDMTQAVTCRYQDKIKNECAPLFEHFRLSHFGYCKLTNSGDFSYVGTHVAWSEYFAAEKLYRNFPYYRHPKYTQEGIHIMKPEEGAFLDALNLGREQFNVQYGLAIIQKLKDGLEGYVFCPDLPDTSHLSLLINEIPLLKLFVKQFKEKNQRLFWHLSDNQVNMVDLIGPDFFENITPGLPYILKREDFLKKLGVSSETLTPAEKRVMKLLPKGRSSRFMGEQLYLSKRTVEHHIERIRDKFSCDSKAELIEKCRELESSGYLKVLSE